MIEMLETNVKEIVLEKLRLRGGHKLPKYAFENLKVEAYEDMYHDCVMIAVECAVAALNDSKAVTKNSKTITKSLAKYPATLSDYIKEKYAPKWFLDKYPVKYVEYYQYLTTVTEYTTTNMKVFPDISINNHKEILRIYENPFTSL